MYSGVYDTPQIYRIEILLWHLYTNIGPTELECFSIQWLAHFALALKTPKESIMLFFAQKFELMLNSSLKFCP